MSKTFKIIRLIDGQAVGTVTLDAAQVNESKVVHSVDLHDTEGLLFAWLSYDYETVKVEEAAG